MNNNEPVVIAEKNLHKGQLHGSVSNGCACLTISDNISLRFIALNQTFVQVQVMHHGIGSTPKTQTWQKVKLVKEKVLVKPKPQKESKPQMVQTQIAQTVETEEVI